MDFRYLLLQVKNVIRFIINIQDISFLITQSSPKKTTGPMLFRPICLISFYNNAHPYLVSSLSPIPSTQPPRYIFSINLHFLYPRVKKRFLLRKGEEKILKSRYEKSSSKTTHKKTTFNISLVAAASWVTP